ncbi:MAG: thiol reductase thioredoxin [Lachnospiraceae bacterium]|nr:thiol reductase thioredoxin [Lachnospiraceae bacterium]
MAARISEKDFEERVIKATEPVVVEFYNDGCVACKKLAPVLGDIEDTYEGRVHFYKVNTNFDPDLVVRYDITAAPTLLFISGGEEKDRLIGTRKAEEITSRVESYL